MKRLEILRDHPPDSYQRLLREASHECRKAALGHDWSTIELQLKQEGVQCLLARDHQYSNQFEYLAMPEMWVAGDGRPHSLYLEFTIARTTPDIDPCAQPGVVSVAAARPET